MDNRPEIIAETYLGGERQWLGDLAPTAHYARTYIYIGKRVARGVPQISVRLPGAVICHSPPVSLRHTTREEQLPYVSFYTTLPVTRVDVSFSLAVPP